MAFSSSTLVCSDTRLPLTMKVSVCGTRAVHGGSVQRGTTRVGGGTAGPAEADAWPAAGCYPPRLGTSAAQTHPLETATAQQRAMLTSSSPSSSPPPSSSAASLTMTSGLSWAAASRGGMTSCEAVGQGGARRGSCKEGFIQRWVAPSVARGREGCLCTPPPPPALCPCTRCRSRIAAPHQRTHTTHTHTTTVNFQYRLTCRYGRKSWPRVLQMRAPACRGTGRYQDSQAVPGGGGVEGGRHKAVTQAVQAGSGPRQAACLHQRHRTAEASRRRQQLRRRLHMHRMQGICAIPQGTRRYLQHVGGERVVAVQPRRLHLLHVLHDALGVVPAVRSAGTAMRHSSGGHASACVCTNTGLSRCPPRQTLPSNGAPKNPRQATKLLDAGRQLAASSASAQHQSQPRHTHPNRSLPTASPTRLTHSSAFARSSCCSLPACEGGVRRNEWGSGVAGGWWWVVMGGDADAGRRGGGGTGHLAASLMA